jgi:starch-binding outer membrane protein SusE/F
MKNTIKLLAGLIITAMVFVACKKEINSVTYQGGTAPVVTATTLGPVVLTKADENKVWATFTWTNPNYQLSTGLSSHDVTYTLQFDTTGSNFTTANPQEIVVSKDLSRAVTVKEINTAMTKLGLKEDIAHNMEVRIRATLPNISAPLYSNVLKAVITGYLDVAVTLPQNLPTPNVNNGDLFIVGSATAGGWNNPVPVLTQKFTRLANNTTYEITVALIGGQQYLFLPKNGDWGYKYGNTCGTDGCNSSTGADFQVGGSNFGGPSASGNYKIVVDFKLGKFTVTKL